MNEVNLNIDELHDFVGHIITNNRHLQSSGKKPVAIEVVGESGIGKTTSIMDSQKILYCMKYHYLIYILVR